MKVQPNNATAKRELNAYLRLKGKTRVVPKLYATWVCGGTLFLILEQAFACKASRTSIKKAYDELFSLGWLHVDAHPDNIMCRGDGSVCIVDFGWAVNKDDEPFFRHPSGETSFKGMLCIQNENLRDL